MSPDPALLGVMLFVALFVLIGFGLMVGFVVALFSLAAAERRQEQEASRRRAEALHELGFVPDPSGRWTGSFEGTLVHYRSQQVQDRKKHYTLHHWGISVPTGSLYLGANGIVALGQDLRVGDPRFDGRFVVGGEPEDLVLLTPRARELLLWLPGAACKDGRLTSQSRSFEPQTPEVLLELARTMLQMPPDLPGRLRLAVTDPAPAVRLRSLAAAVERDLALGRELAASLRQDEDASVRGVAEALLREDGLVDLLLSGEVDMPQRLWAARVLVREGSPAQRLGAGQALLGKGSTLQSAAVALVRSLGDEGEPLLLAEIDSAEGEVLGQILLALQEMGSVAAVPALRARQARLSVLQGGLSKAIDHTVLVLQERAGGERGGLALAGSPEQQGALSVAPDRGALSPALREGT
jgi:hypothetical protein